MKDGSIFFEVFRDVSRSRFLVRTSFSPLSFAGEGLGDSFCSRLREFSTNVTSIRTSSLRKSRSEGGLCYLQLWQSPVTEAGCYNSACAGRCSIVDRAARESNACGLTHLSVYLCLCVRSTARHLDHRRSRPRDVRDVRKKAIGHSRRKRSWP